MAKNAPLFSILLPTKNRSHIIGAAIESVLNQSIDDFELIISDNDDSEVNTKKVVDLYSDKRIKYYRTTGNLSMPDNWENARKYSVGQFLTVLQDKQILYHDALETIKNILFKTSVNVLTWRTDSLDNKGKRNIYIKYSGSNKLICHSSNEIISKYLRQENDSWIYLPRMINTCIRKEQVDKITENIKDKKLFIDVTPDLSASFIILNAIKNIYHIDKSLGVWSSSMSNAISLRKKDEKHIDFINKIQDKKIICKYVPIKSNYIIKNIVLNDYKNVASLFKGNLDDRGMSNKTYIRMCFTDILKSILYGANMRKEIILWINHIKISNKTDKSQLVSFCIKLTINMVFKKIFFIFPSIANRFFKARNKPVKIYSDTDLDLYKLVYDQLN